MKHNNAEIFDMSGNSINNRFKTPQYNVDVINTSSDYKRIISQLVHLALNSADQLSEGIDACKSLMRCLHNGADLNVGQTFHDPCAQVLIILNDMDDKSVNYQPLLKSLFDDVTQRFQWYSLFKDRVIAPHQLRIVNAPSLYPYFKQGAFTIEQLSTVTQLQRVNLFDRDVLSALANGTLSFDSAMSLSFQDRERLAQPQDKKSLIK